MYSVIPGLYEGWGPYLTLVGVSTFLLPNTQKNKKRKEEYTVVHDFSSQLVYSMTVIR